MTQNLNDFDNALPLLRAEERLTVDVVSKPTGKVLVRTVTEDHVETAQSDVLTTVVEITRVPVNYRVTEVPADLVVGDTRVVCIVSEVLVVEKHLMVTEEIHIRHRTESEQVQVPVTLRRQTVTVERTDLRTGEVVTEKLSPLNED